MLLWTVKVGTVRKWLIEMSLIGLDWVWLMVSCRQGVQHSVYSRIADSCVKVALVGKPVAVFSSLDVTNTTERAASACICTHDANHRWCGTWCE